MRLGWGLHGSAPESGNWNKGDAASEWPSIDQVGTPPARLHLGDLQAGESSNFDAARTLRTPLVMSACVSTCPNDLYPVAISDDRNTGGVKALGHQGHVRTVLQILCCGSA